MTETKSVSPVLPSQQAQKSGGPLHLAALIGANVALAFGPLFVRLADTDPVATGFWRLALAVPLLFLLAWRGGSGRSWGGRSWGVTPVTLALVAAAGLFFALDIASWHLGIVQTRMANATLFGNSASLLLVIYAMIATRALPRLPEGIGVMLAAAGAILLLGRSYELSPEHLTGDLLCLLAGLLYTGYIVSMQRARGRLDSWPALALSTLASTVPLIVIAVMLGERIWPQDWTAVLLLALSSQIVGQGLLIYALPHFSPLVVGVALLTQPVVSAAIGWSLFDERLAAMDLLGGAMVAAALVLVRWPSRRLARPVEEPIVQP